MWSPSLGFSVEVTGLAPTPGHSHAGSSGLSSCHRHTHEAPLSPASSVTSLRGSAGSTALSDAVEDVQGRTDLP